MFPVTMNILTMASLVGATSKHGFKLRECLLKQRLEDTYEQVQFSILKCWAFASHINHSEKKTIWHDLYCYVQIMT